jgi:hypothetical protein
MRMSLVADVVGIKNDEPSARLEMPGRMSQGFSSRRAIMLRASEPRFSGAGCQAGLGRHGRLTAQTRALKSRRSRKAAFGPHPSGADALLRWLGGNA